VKSTGHTKIHNFSWTHCSLKSERSGNGYQGQIKQTAA